MTIQPHDFLSAAADLADGRCVEAEEPRARTMVGRMYYAAFLEVREAVRSEKSDPSWDSRHQALAAKLRSDSDPEVAMLGAYLDDLRQSRTVADYRLGKSVSLLKAKLLQVNARAVLSDARSLASRFPAL